MSCRAKEVHVRKLTRWLIPIILLFLVHPLRTQSLRPSHWTGPSIDFLQARGLLWSLSPLTRPYAIDQTANLVEKEAGSSSDATRLAYEHALMLRSFLRQANLQPGQASIALESFNGLDGMDDEWLYHGTQRLFLACKPAPWLEIYNAILVDNRLDESPRYIGIRQSGYAGYTEQACVRVRHKGFSAGFGRDFLRIGPGIDAALLLSDYPRPLDQVQLAFQNKWLSYRFMTATLNDTNYPDDQTPGHQNRYLTLHHLQISPVKNLYIGIGEAILYGGPDSGLDFNFLNPFLSYHGEQMNGPSGGNTMGSVHVAALLHNKYLFYTDLLIDDVQIEKSGPGDLEPNEYGLLSGLRCADPFGINGADFSLEYTRITNRTYNGQGGPWEKWLHRNESMGHYLGNDFDRLYVSCSYWPVLRWRSQVQFQHRRRGEGRIEKPFDTPWDNVPVGESYSEPFPTGVVETLNEWRLDLTFQPAWWLRAFASAAQQDFENHRNVKGADKSEWLFSFGIDWSLHQKFDFVKAE